jgi:hypothetical protein
VLADAISLECPELLWSWHALENDYATRGARKSENEITN